MFPQVRAVLVARARLLGIRLVFGNPATAPLPADLVGIYVQSPDDYGALVDPRSPSPNARTRPAACLPSGPTCSPTSCSHRQGDLGADVVVGSAQRFGVPLGYGGPHAAFFATREAFVRQVPGRIIGVSVDEAGRRAYRMALQTREQHIRREKATSNICTAQALLANIAAFYAVYHGPAGLEGIATRVHDQTVRLAAAIERRGWRQVNAGYFDTLRVEAEPTAIAQIRAAAAAREINFRYPSDSAVQIALDETVDEADLCDLVRVFDEAAGQTGAPTVEPPGARTALHPGTRRTSSFMTHPVFNSHQSETEMMRYIRHLERKDLGLDTAMIPLGSCTMKLNGAAEMMPISWPEFARLHPFVPPDQAAGYRQIFDELEAALAAITGLAAVSLQPNSGAQGELAGLLAIRAYHRVAGRPRAHRRPDSPVGPRHESGQCRHGRPHGGRRRLRRPRQHRGRGSSCQGRRAPDADRLPDGDLSEHARRLRVADPGDLRDRPRRGRPGVHGRREHERAGRADQPRGHGRRRVPSEPAQDVRDSARWRRPRDGADCRRARTSRRSFPAIRWCRPGAPRPSPPSPPRRGAARAFS